MGDEDLKQLHDTISKMASAVNRSARHTEQIPEIKKKVESTSEKVIQLDTKFEAERERVTKIENKVEGGHDCYQVDVIAEVKDAQREASQKIEKDVQKGIEQEGKIAALVKEQSETEADVADIKKAPRRMFYGLLGVILTIVTGAGGAIWFLAQLESDVEHEREQRVEQFKRIETQIKQVAQKADPTPVKQALSDLSDDLEEANGHEEEFNRMCDGMGRYEKRFLKTSFSKRGKRVPASCLE